MPKAPPRGKGPLSLLFAINKPSGVPSMTLLNSLQPLLASSSLFKEQTTPNNYNNNNNKRKNNKSRKAKWKEERVKLGQGGTLDPLADGVLVLGVNGATKELSTFLDCTKDYRAIGLLGCSTDSYDSEGKRVHVKSTEGITREKIEGVLDQFRGEIEQTPPIYSALKMDGKPLYEYARNKIPLPRPISPRKVHVHSLTLKSFTEGSMQTLYEYPKESLGKNEVREIERLEEMVKSGGTVVPDEKEEVVGDEPLASEEAGRSPIFEIEMTVSGGTYVRSIVHDIGEALGSAAHVVKLTRTRQGEFALNDHPPSTSTITATSFNDDAPAPTASTTDATSSTAITEDAPPPPPVESNFSGGCVEWEILEAGLKALKSDTTNGDKGGDQEMRPWEAEILHRCKLV